jgi:two-component system, cell cycle sensor histidine kinase and response regulator CckA
VSVAAKSPAGDESFRDAAELGVMSMIGVALADSRRTVGCLFLDSTGNAITSATEHESLFRVLADVFTNAVSVRDDRREARRIEEQYRQAQRLESIGRLAGGIAHDFNNLLTVILGNTELAMASGVEDIAPEHADLSGVLVRSLTDIRTAAERAASLTSQLLAYSRKQLLAPETFDINDPVGAVHSLLGRILGEDITITLDLEPRAGWVSADRAQLEQVVMNLATNARDAMPSGGVFALETASTELDEEFVRKHPPLLPGRYARLRVRDTGTGMDSTTVAHIFEPFFTTKPVGKGTGLGLASAYGTITQSGGHIGVESAVGRGTTFTIYLPVAEEAR